MTKELKGTYVWLNTLVQNDLMAYDMAFKDLIDLEDKLARSDSALSILATAIESVKGTIDLKDKFKKTCLNCKAIHVIPTYEPCKSCKDPLNIIDYSNWSSL